MTKKRADPPDILHPPAADYDRVMAEAGYEGPTRAAAALAGAGAAHDAPLIEFGAGTGLVGVALRSLGFTAIDGLEPDPDMRAIARARPGGIYRQLLAWDWQGDPPVEPGTYMNAAAVGVLAPGWAPASVIDQGLRLIPPGGLFVFSISDLARNEIDYVGRIRENVDCGFVEIAFREYGRFLPGADLKADIYVLRRR
ncbi:class I SAM-dependent methyltransferase [Amaricoccus solimangrovi]|uniref:Class I SAM-dependent methyltransferase n=1 Tax=Amaricoccus solimangrovi TaxID=2589815 RepID=A0A501WQ77_9RHOB|nr:class I SAM-dependent methyltransferase [Amaricoccus solimangrovi]TPE50485.1 class I SAM-dependent methyltransferase [Amaricoccus solimangrovi]